MTTTGPSPKTEIHDIADRLWETAQVGVKVGVKVGVRPKEPSAPFRADLVTTFEVVPGSLLQPDLDAELGTFDFSINAWGRELYEAASGTYDDLVLALALAIWWAERRGQGAAFSEVWAQRALDGRG